jgi:tRNA (guanine37-N1)-methyltransferase
VDERIFELLDIERVSIGNFVLSSGELPAMTLAEAVLRRLADVIGNPNSVTHDSIISGLLEYPHYCSPRTFSNYEVPEILLSGHHGRINDWKQKESIKATLFKKPSLLVQYPATDQDKKTIVEILEGEII